MKPLTAADARKADLYRTHLPLAADIAWKFTRRFGWSFYDMQMESESLLALICSGWDQPVSCFEYEPGRTGGRSPTAWIYFHLYTEMMTICTRRTKRHATEFSVLTGSDEDAKLHLADKGPGWLARLMSDLSDDARELVQVFISAPDEIANILKESRKVGKRRRKVLVEYLDQLTALPDWDEQRLTRAWQEVAACL